ncbi:hypothetical protein HN011_002946 [Eciton burchellii]|nr:hypothetical protein HN011_002946 [Eciton burchellii]
MSRLEEDRVIAISSSFYKNVFLLTQMVPSSFQFQQHFRKDMFDKPNTAGFLHVSHYLSIIYDAKLFKRMVKWPISCKRDEAIYRAEIKNFFSLLSKDNPDVKFPSILMSHLVQSTGTKFLTFMWKLSQLALRIYIKGEHSLVQERLLNAPHTGPMDDLTIRYLNNVNTEMRCLMANTFEKTKRILDVANDFINDEIETLNMYKLEIFEKKKIIEKLVLECPVNALVQKRLTNVEDSSIINLWKIDISHKFQYISRKNEELNKFKESCKHLCKIILRIKSNSEILDANQFPKINCDYYLLRNQSYMQDGLFTFSTLLSLLHVTLTQMQCHINADFSDVSPYSLHIQSTCELMKSLRILFVALNTRVNNMLDEQYISQKIQDINIDFDTKNLLITNPNIFLQSPEINFNFSQYTGDNLFHERLYSPPTEDKHKHKHLFKRYSRRYCPYEIPAVLSDLTNSWNNMSGWLSPRAYSTKYIYKGKPLSPLYSRLLYNSKLKSKQSKEKCNSSVNYEALNLTPRKRLVSEHSTIKTSKKTRNLFNSVTSSSCLSSITEN